MISIDEMLLLFALGILLSSTVIDADAQEAVGGVNDAFGGVSKNLRGILDAFRDIENFFDQLGCHFMGMFTGYDNLPEGSVCL